MLIEQAEYVKTSSGGHIKKRLVERDFSKSENRDGELCVFCNYDDYPNCKSYCSAYTPKT